ncbi:hypothetical protein Pelo_7423 [Pelomyxa schiedti]|nr:hypothetical protein Pelo_7423 [Pelomyxa schiedti]
MVPVWVFFVLCAVLLLVLYFTRKTEPISKPYHSDKTASVRWNQEQTKLETHGNVPPEVKKQLDGVATEVLNKRKPPHAN